MLLGIYPFGKRFTNFLQVILGLSLGTCVILAVHSVNVEALPAVYRLPSLYLVEASTMLVVFYDVMYARQDTADDIKSGARGMAVHFRNSIPTLMAGLVCGVIAFLNVLGRSIGMGFWYFVLAVAGVFLGLVFIISVIIMDRDADKPRHYDWHYAMVIFLLIGLNTIGQIYRCEIL
jgi:4-hydroxybenzoate polyprenyltransferase